MIDVPIGEQLGLDYDELSPDEAEGIALAAEAALAEMMPLEMMCLGRVRIGDHLTVGGQPIEVLQVRPRTVQDFHPPLYGDHLRGHEGEIGTIVWYQPVHEEDDS